jgi:hypothetical protein
MVVAVGALNDVAGCDSLSWAATDKECNLQLFYPNAAGLEKKNRENAQKL